MAAPGWFAGFIDRKCKGIAMLILQVLGALVTLAGLALLLTRAVDIVLLAIDDSIEAKRDIQRARKLPHAY